MSPSALRPFALGLNLIAYGLVACVIGAGLSGTSMMLHRATALKIDRAGRGAQLRAHRVAARIQASGAPANSSPAPALGPTQDRTQNPTQTRG